MKKYMVGSILLLFCLLLTSCAVNQNFTPMVVKELKPSELSKVYNTKPQNLAALSKCSSPPSIKITNAEANNNKDFTFYRIWPFNWQITPNILADNIVVYMNNAFAQCGIKANQNSTNVIHVTLGTVESNLPFMGVVCTTDTKLKIVIPEINYIKTYEHSESTPRGPVVGVAYNIHEITQQMINDPVIQDYLLCTDMKAKTGSSSGEAALDIIKKRYAIGAITKDQFEQMKKDIQQR